MIYKQNTVSSSSEAGKKEKLWTDSSATAPELSLLFKLS